MKFLIVQMGIIQMRCFAIANLHKTEETQRLICAKDWLMDWTTKPYLLHYISGKRDLALSLHKSIILVINSQKEKCYTMITNSMILHSKMIYGHRLSKFSWRWKILIDLLKYENISTCRGSYEIPFRQGHSKCYNISHICSYKVSSFGRIEPCSNGAHLQNREHFECNIMFKCLKSYCIPWANVCDGKEYCSTGEDKTYPMICTDKTVCANMFKCRGERNKCLHLGDTCNNIIDCPQADDENLCELKHLNCPDKYICLALAIYLLKLGSLFFQ